MNVLWDVDIVRTDECIPEEERIVGEDIVRYLETEFAQIANGEYGRRARIALAKSVNLPNIRNKAGAVRDGFVRIKVFVVEFAFALEFLLKCRRDDIGTFVAHHVFAQNPLLLRDVVVADLSGELVHASEKLAMDGDIRGGRKLKSQLCEDFGDALRNNVRFVGASLGGLRATALDLVVVADDLARFGEGYFPLDVAPRRFQEIRGRHKSIHLLKLDRRAPNLRLLALSRLPRLRVLFKIVHVLVPVIGNWQWQHFHIGNIYLLPPAQGASAGRPCTAEATRGNICICGRGCRRPQHSRAAKARPY